jgi:hypothetical protein
MPVFDADDVRFNKADVFSVRSGSSSSDDTGRNRASVQALSSACSDGSIDPALAAIAAAAAAAAAEAAEAASSPLVAHAPDVHATVRPFKLHARPPHCTPST